MSRTGGEVCWMIDTRMASVGPIVNLVPWLPFHF